MTEFNQDDLEHLSYAVEFIYRIEPIEWGFPFNGKIWLLTGNRTSSAGERVAIEAMSSGFATLAGERTGGISTGDRMFIHLPNTNIIQPVDVGYVVDSLGRAQTEFGVIPHYLTPPRVNALDMVLAIIAEMDE
jgi:C-terminal processing protease CtpA/Prc